MTPTRTLAALVALPLLSSCWVRPTDMDPAEISAQYAHKRTEPCPSWLRSHRTGFEYCASPAMKVDVPVNTGSAPAPAKAGGTADAVDETQIDKASLMAHGETVYTQTCAACHQGNGMGVAGAFPPLAGSGEYYGGPKKHAAMIINGVTGPITVQGVEWNGMMPPQGSLSDYDIAAVATFERHSWGNDDGIVVPADVAAARKGGE